MDTDGLKKVLKAYGYSAAGILPFQKGYRNTSYPVELENGERINFILYKDEPGIDQRIRRIHDVSLFLAKHTIPVRYPVDSKILMLQTPSTKRYGALYTYLPGDTIPWEAYTKNHIKLVGMAMGELHVTLKSFGSLDNDVTVEYSDITRRMQRYFTDKNVTCALSQKLRIAVPLSSFVRFQNLLTYCHSLPDKQVLHMDFVRGNLLFRTPQPNDRLAIENVALSGILDFEKVAYGSPIIDMARTLAFLLVDCKYKAPEKIRKYFLHSGYNKRSNGENISLDSELLDRLVALFLMYDFYKFLLHNPYEFLPQNEHFTRTRDMLLSIGMIRYTKDR